MSIILDHITQVFALTKQIHALAVGHTSSCTVKVTDNGIRTSIIRIVLMNDFVPSAKCTPSLSLLIASAFFKEIRAWKPSVLAHLLRTVPHLYENLFERGIENSLRFAYGLPIPSPLIRGGSQTLFVLAYEERKQNAKKEQCCGEWWRVSIRELPEAPRDCRRRSLSGDLKL